MAVWVLLLVAAILLLATVLPRVRRRPSPPAPSSTGDAPTALQLYARNVNAAPSAGVVADASGASVALLPGGAAHRGVVATRRERGIVLTTARLEAGRVAFAGSGAYEVVAAGAFVHADFVLEASGSGELRYGGESARGHLAARRRVVNGASRCWGLAVPGAVLAAHDLSGASTPRVPEVAKHGAIQAFSIRMSCGASSSSRPAVSIFVIPRSGAAAAIDLAFFGNDLHVGYRALPAGASVREIAEAPKQAPAHALTGARTGRSKTDVRVEVARGRVRVCVADGAARRAWYLESPVMADDAPYRPDAEGLPPSVMVRTVDADAVVVVPFSVGDLAVL